MPVLTPHVPDGLIDLMKALTKSILKEKPEDIYKFAVQHFEKLIIERDGNLDKGYERFRSESQYFKEKKEYEKLLNKNQRSAEKAPPKEQTEVASDENVTEEKDTQSAQAVQRTNKFKTRKLSSRKPSETLIAIKEEDGEETAKHELDNEMQRREWAAFKIQRAFRRFYEKIKKGGSSRKSKMSQETAALIIQRTLKTIFRRKKLDDDKTEQTKLDDSVDITPRIDSSEVDKMEREISTEVSKEVSAVPAESIKKSLGFPLRQNSDDPHPSIAFGERCTESDEKQDLLKSDLKIEDSDVGPSTDVKTDEVDPMHQGSQESEVVKKQSLEKIIPKEDEKEEIVERVAEKDLDSHENENAEEAKLVDTKDGILTKESSSDLQIGENKDQLQQREDTDKQSNLQEDEVSSNIAQEEKTSEQAEEKHVAENILKEPGKTTEDKSDENHVENELNRQEEVKDTAKIENGDSLGNEHLIPMDDTVGSLAKMIKHEKEEKELDETDKSEKLDDAQEEVTDEKKADGKSPNPPDSSGNMDNLQDKADNQDSKDTTEKSDSHLVPMDGTVESLADMIKHEKEVKEMDKNEKKELAEHSSSESTGVKTAEEEAIKEVTGEGITADTSKSDGKLESEADNQDSKNICEESSNHLVAMDDTIESLANMIKHEKEEKEMDKGDKGEEAKSSSSEPTNSDEDPKQGSEKIASAKKPSATSGNSDKLKAGVDDQDTNIAEESDKHLVPMDDTIESLANMIKHEKEEKEMDKTDKGEEDQSSPSEPRKDNNVDKKDIEEIASDKKSIDTSGDHSKLEEKGDSQDSKPNAEKSDNHLVPMDGTVESLANIIKQEKEMDKTGKPEQGESSFSEPANTNSPEGNGTEEVINERESAHAFGKDNKLEKTVDSEDTKNITENSDESAEKASDVKETSSADNHLVPMDGTLESLAKMIKHEKDEKLHETDPPVDESTTDIIKSTSENPINPSSEENQDEVNSEIDDGPGEKVMITATAEETEPLILEDDILPGASETKFDHLAEKGSDLTKTQEDNESEKKSENQSEDSSHGIGATGARDSNDTSLLATETSPEKDETEKAATESTEQTGGHVTGEQISDEESVQSLKDKKETHQDFSKDELTEAEIKAIEAEIIEPEIVQKTNSLTESAKVEEQDPPANKPESKAGSAKSNISDNESHQDKEVTKKAESDSASAEIGASGGIPKDGASTKEKSDGSEASEYTTSIGLNIEGSEVAKGDEPVKENSDGSDAPEVAADIGVNTKDSVAPTEIQNGDVNQTAGVAEALSGDVQGSKSVDLDKASGVEPEVIVETNKHENQALPKKESDEKSTIDEKKDENFDQDKANTQEEEHAQSLSKSSPQNVDNPIQPTEDVDTKAGSEIHSDVEKPHLESQETGQLSVNEENQKEAESQDKSVELANASQNDESVPDKVDTPESGHVNGASSSLLNESTSPLSTEGKKENELPTDDSAPEKTSNSQSDIHDHNTEETRNEEGPSSQQKDNLPESAPESKKEAENVSDSTDILKDGIQTTAVQDDAGDSGKLPENGDSEGTASTESSDPKEPSSSKDENVPVLAVEVSEADEKKLGGGIKENSKELPSPPLVEQEVPPESADSKATSDPLIEAKESIDSKPTSDSLTDAKESGVASDFEKSKELTATSENANWNEESLAESIRDFKGRTSDSTKIVGEDEKLVKDQPATAVTTMGSGANFEDESNTVPPATSNAANRQKDELPQEVDNLSKEDKSQADSENIIESNPSEKWSEVQPDKNAENKTSSNMTAESNPNLGNPSSELDLESQTDEDNMSEAELSGVIFEAGENKENEAGNPKQINKNTKSNMQGTPKSDKGKDCIILTHAFNIVELNPVDDLSNADVIGNQLVEARNDLEITDDSRYVPDSNLCDTNNKDKASELNQSDIEGSNGGKRTKRSLSPFDFPDGSSSVRQQFDDDFVNVEDPWKAANEVSDDVTSNEKDHLKIASVPGEFGTSKEPAVENVPVKMNIDSMKTFAAPPDNTQKKPEKTDIVNRNDKSKSVEEKPKSGKNPDSAQQRARDVACEITIKDAQKQHQPNNSPGSDPSLSSVEENKQETGADPRPSSVKNKDQNQPPSDSGESALLDNGKVVSKGGEPTLQDTKPKSEIGSTSLDERQVSEISQKDQNVAKDLKNEGTNVGSSPKRAVENLSNSTKDLSSEAEEKSKAEKNGDTTTENSKNQLVSNSSNPTTSAPSEDKGKSKMGTNGETSSTNPGEGSLSNPTVLSSTKTEEEPKEGTNKDFEISSFENNAPTDGFKEKTKDRKDKKDETIPEYKSNNPQPETKDAGVEVSKEINPLNITSEPKLEKQIATTANHQEKEKNPHDITHPTDTKLDNVLKNTQEVSSNAIPSAPTDSNSPNVTSGKEKENEPQESNIKSALADSEKEQEHEKRETDSKTNIEGMHNNGQPPAEKSSMEIITEDNPQMEVIAVKKNVSGVEAQTVTKPLLHDADSERSRMKGHSEQEAESTSDNKPIRPQPESSEDQNVLLPKNSSPDTIDQEKTHLEQDKTNLKTNSENAVSDSQNRAEIDQPAAGDSPRQSKVSSEIQSDESKVVAAKTQEPEKSPLVNTESTDQKLETPSKMEEAHQESMTPLFNKETEKSNNEINKDKKAPQSSSDKIEDLGTEMSGDNMKNTTDNGPMDPKQEIKEPTADGVHLAKMTSGIIPKKDESAADATQETTKSPSDSENARGVKIEDISKRPEEKLSIPKSGTESQEVKAPNEIEKQEDRKDGTNSDVDNKNVDNDPQQPSNGLTQKGSDDTAQRSEMPLKIDSDKKANGSVDDQESDKPLSSNTKRGKDNPSKEITGTIENPQQGPLNDKEENSKIIGDKNKEESLLEKMVPPNSTDKVEEQKEESNQGTLKEKKEEKPNELQKHNVDANQGMTQPMQESEEITKSSSAKNGKETVPDKTEEASKNPPVNMPGDVGKMAGVVAKDSNEKKMHEKIEEISSDPNPRPENLITGLAKEELSPKDKNDESGSNQGASQGFTEDKSPHHQDEMKVVQEQTLSDHSPSKNSEDQNNRLGSATKSGHSHPDLDKKVAPETTHDHSLNLAVSEKTNGAKTSDATIDKHKLPDPDEAVRNQSRQSSANKSTSHSKKPVIDDVALKDLKSKEPPASGSKGTQPEQHQEDTQPTVASLNPDVHEMEVTKLNVSPVGEAVNEIESAKPIDKSSTSEASRSPNKDTSSSKAGSGNRKEIGTELRSKDEPVVEKPEDKTNYPSGLIDGKKIDSLTEKKSDSSAEENDQLGKTDNASGSSNRDKTSSAKSKRENGMTKEEPANEADNAKSMNPALDSAVGKDQTKTTNPSIEESENITDKLSVVIDSKDDSENVNTVSTESHEPKAKTTDDKESYDEKKDETPSKDKKLSSEYDPKSSSSHSKVKGPGEQKEEDLTVIQNGIPVPLQQKMEARETSVKNETTDPLKKVLSLESAGDIPSPDKIGQGLTNSNTDEHKTNKKGTEGKHSTNGLPADTAVNPNSEDTKNGVQMESPGNNTRKGSKDLTKPSSDIKPEENLSKPNSSKIDIHDNSLPVNTNENKQTVSKLTEKPQDIFNEQKDSKPEDDKPAKLTSKTEKQGSAKSRDSKRSEEKISAKNLPGAVAETSKLAGQNRPFENVENKFQNEAHVKSDSTDLKEDSTTSPTELVAEEPVTSKIYKTVEAGNVQKEFKSDDSTVEQDDPVTADKGSPVKHNHPEAADNDSTAKRDDPSTADNSSKPFADTDPNSAKSDDGAKSISRQTTVEVGSPEYDEMKMEPNLMPEESKATARLDNLQNQKNPEVQTPNALEKDLESTSFKEETSNPLEANNNKSDEANNKLDVKNVNIKPETSDGPPPKSTSETSADGDTKNPEQIRENLTKEDKTEIMTINSKSDKLASSTSVTGAIDEVAGKTLEDGSSKQTKLKEKSEVLKDSKEKDTIQKQEEVKGNENLKDENQTHHSTKHQDANQKQGEEKDQKDEKSSSRIDADFKEETPFSPTSGSTESNLSSEGNRTLPESIQTNLAPEGKLKGELNSKPEKQGGNIHSPSDNVESTLANYILSKKEEIKEPNKEQKGSDLEKQFNEPKKEQKGLDIQKKFNEPNEDQTGSDAQKGTNELNKDQKDSDEHKEINEPKKEQKGFDAMKMKEDNLNEGTSEEDKTKIATGCQLSETSEEETLSHASAEKLPSAIDGSIPQQNPEDTTKPAKIMKETEVGEASDSQRKATSETKADDIKVVEDPKSTKPDQLDKTTKDTQDADDNIEGVPRAADQSQVKDNDGVSTEIKPDQELPTSKEDGTTAESPNANVEGKEDSKNNTKTESLEKKTVSPLQSATKAPQKDPKNEETLVDSDKNKGSDTKKAGQGSEKKDPVKVVSLPEVSLKPKEGLEGQHIDNIAENSEPTMGHENRVEKDSDEPTAKKMDLSNVTTEPASQVSQEGTKKGSDNITLTQPSDERYNKWMMLQPAKEDENRSSNEMKLQDDDIDPASVALSDHLTQKSEPNIEGETVEKIIPPKQMTKMLAKFPSKTEKIPTSSDETNKGGEETSKSSKTEHNIPTSANKYGKVEETLDSKEKLAHTPKSESEDGEARKTDAVKLEEKNPSTLDLKKVEAETKKGDADAKQDDNGVKKDDTEDKKDDTKDQAGNISNDKKEDEIVERITSDKIHGEEDLVEKAKNLREGTVIPDTQIQTNIESADNHDSNRTKESLPLGDKKQENSDSEKALSLPKSETEKATPSTFERNSSKTVDSIPEKYDKKESQTKLDKNLAGKGQITESADKPTEFQEPQLEKETLKEAISVKSTEDNDPKKAKEKMQSALKNDAEESEGKPTEADISKSKAESTLKEEPEKIRKDSAKLISKASSGKLTDKQEVLSEAMVSPPKSSETSPNKFEEKDKLEQGNLEETKDSTSEKNRTQLEPTAPVVSSTKESDLLESSTLLNDSMVPSTEQSKSTTVKNTATEQLGQDKLKDPAHPVSGKSSEQPDSDQQASNAATSLSSEASSISSHSNKRNIKKSHSAITDSPSGKNKGDESRTKSAKGGLHAENITSSSVPLLSTDHDLPRNEDVSHSTPPFEDKKDEHIDVKESKKPEIGKHDSSKNLKPDSVISTEESTSEAKFQLSTEKQQTKDDISNQDIEKVDLAAIESQILTPEADITKKPHEEKASGSDISNTDPAAKQIFDAAAKTIQHAFRSYKDHKDEPQPNKDTSSSSDIKSPKSLDPERKTSITIVETNNGLDVVARDTDSKAIWYVGEEPIIPTATPTKEIEHPFENISTDSVVFGQLLDSGNESGQTSFDSSGKLDDLSKIGKVGSVLDDQPKPTNLKKETGEDPVKKSEASESLNVESKPDTKLQSEKVESAQSQPLEINDSKSDNYILSDVKEISSTAKDTNVIPAPQKVKDGGTTIELKETTEPAETNLKSPAPPMEKPSNLVEKSALTKKDSQSLPAKDETPVNKDSSLEEKSKSTERTAQPISGNLEVLTEKKPKESVGNQTKKQGSHADKLHTSSTGKSSVVKPNERSHEILTKETKKEGKPVVGASDPDTPVFETTENVAVHPKDESSLTKEKPIDSKNEAEMPVIIEPTIEPDSLEPDYTSPRSDVENMDISMYGEDSLEAMYYSLKKHEMLLDKMHKQASVCKSASSERPKLDGTVENVSEGTSSTFDTPQEENSQIKDADKKPANEDKSQENDTQKSTSDLDNKVESVEENSELTVEIAPVKERRLSRNDSYYEACLSRPITSASISPRTKAELDSENPIELSRKRTEHFIKQLHTPSTDKNMSIDVDETTNDEIRRNMLAYSMSEADSDYCEPGERTNALFNDFNISTAFETTPSTDTDSTIISAVTKIQAGARGFLTRRRLRRASVATTSFPERKPSFGNDAIGESLEDFIGEEDAAKRIQKSFRRYRNRKTRQSAPSLRNNVTDESSSKSSNSSDEKVMKIIDVKLEHKPSAPKGNQEERKSDEGDQKNNFGKTESRETTLSEEKKQEPGMSLDGLNLAARRMTLQRGDAVQSNSTGEDESSSTSGNGSEERADINQGSKKQLPRAKSSGTERAEKKKPEPRNDVERIKRFGTRQRTMPVQIDFEILRVLPKHLRKRIQSAEHQNKRKTDL